MPSERRRLLMAVAVAATLALIVIAVRAPLRSLAATSAVTITDDSFSPNSYAPNPITVRAGDTVTWTNNGPSTHTVTSDAGSAMAFDSGNIAAGGTFTQTFSTPGTFTYHCSIHPGMTGSVIVQAAAAGAATPAAAGASPTAGAAGSSPTAAAGGSSSTPIGGATTSAALPSTGSGPSHGGGAGMWLLVAAAIGAVGVVAVGARIVVSRR